MSTMFPGQFIIHASAKEWKRTPQKVVRFAVVFMPVAQALEWDELHTKIKYSRFGVLKNHHEHL